MNSNAKRVLAELKKNYIEFNTNMPFGYRDDIGTSVNRMYVRSMHTGTFCIANMEFADQVKGQGVLSAFIEFIKENPFNYKGIEVESIFNPRLVDKLLREGFVPRLKIEEGFPPTLVYPLTKDCPIYI